MTLHEAMEKVLRASDGMTSREIADAIARRGLYTKNDGLAAEASQISARARQYPEMFERTGGVIRLRRR